MWWTLQGSMVSVKAALWESLWEKWTGAMLLPMCSKKRKINPKPILPPFPGSPSRAVDLLCPSTGLCVLLALQYTVWSLVYMPEVYLSMHQRDRRSDERTNMAQSGGLVRRTNERKAVFKGRIGCRH